MRGEGFLDLIGGLSAAERDLLLASLGADEVAAVEGDWASWAHAGQLPPDGDWRTWVIMAGRGFGKTRAGAEWVAAMAAAHPGMRIALVAATIDEARRVMIDGQSGLLAVAGERIDRFMPTRRLLRFANGAEAVLFSGASPEALRGPEHHIAWCDELAKWEKPGATWDMLQLGLRLGDPATGSGPRALVTTTPRPGPVLARIIASPGCVVTGGRTRANPHLPRMFVETVERLYAGTRLGRQELDGELLPDVAGALWSVELLERCRVAPLPLAGGAGGGSVGPASSFSGRPTRVQKHVTLNAPSRKREGDYVRTVIGVDPPSGDGTCGIVACGVDAGGIAYVLADHSVTARSPEGWARAVVAAAEVHGAELVVAETNQGGAMVEAVLRAADARVRVRAVTANLSKSERATPVATAFEAGKVRLCGRFAELEAQLCGMIAGGGYAGPSTGSGGRSPDRADAMVWALSELLAGAQRAGPRVRMV